MYVFHSSNFISSSCCHSSDGVRCPVVLSSSSWCWFCWEWWFILKVWSSGGTSARIYSPWIPSSSSCSFSVWGIDNAFLYVHQAHGIDLNIKQKEALWPSLYSMLLIVIHFYSICFSRPLKRGKKLPFVTSCWTMLWKTVLKINNSVKMWKMYVNGNVLYTVCKRKCTVNGCFSFILGNGGIFRPQLFWNYSLLSFN
jgi:hypothetical protein